MSGVAGSLKKTGAGRRGDTRVLRLRAGGLGEAVAERGDLGRPQGRAAVSAPLVFLFSSRRRHTRYWRDWSSDVCSSDLGVAIEAGMDRFAVLVFHDQTLDD